jgi:hypothetical protein
MNNPRQPYVSYLSTDELVRAIERCDVDISRARAHRYQQRVNILKGIRTDLEAELIARQTHWDFDRL